MFEYPVTFTDASGKTIADALLVSAVSIPQQNWNMVYDTATKTTEYGAYQASSPTFAPVSPGPVWLTVPDFTNKTVGFSVDLSSPTYVTAGSVVVVNGTPPTGWTKAGSVLTLTSSSGTAAGPLSGTATLAGISANSNPFNVQGISSLAADTIAPPSVIGVNLTPNPGSNSITLTMAPTNDPFQSGQTRSGLGNGQVTRSLNGAGYTSAGLPASGVLTPATSGISWNPVGQDMGSPATPGSDSQSGASHTLTGYGLYFGTTDTGHIVGAAVAGDFDFVGQIPNFVCTDGFAECGVECRQFNDPVNGPGSPKVGMSLRPYSQGNGCNLDNRTVANATPANTALVTGFTAGASYWFQRRGAVFTLWVNNDPNKLGGTNAPVGQVTNATIPTNAFVNKLVAGGSAVAGGTATITGVINQDGVTSYIDTTANPNTPSQTYAYKVTWPDLAANVSAASEIATYTTGSGSVTPSLNQIFATRFKNADHKLFPGQMAALFSGQPGTGTKYGNLFAGSDPDGVSSSNPCFLNVGTGGNASAATIGQYNTSTHTLVDSGKGPAIAQFNLPTNSGSCTQAQMIQAMTDWQNAGGIAMGMYFCVNPNTGNLNGYSGTPFPNVYTPGTTENNYLVNNAEWGLSALVTILNALPKRIVMRMDHEMNGNWFWYGFGQVGGGAPTTQQFMAYWRYKYAYLKAHVTPSKFPVIVWGPNWASGNYVFNSAQGGGKALTVGDDFDIWGIDWYFGDTFSNLASGGYNAFVAAFPGTPGCLPECGQQGANNSAISNFVQNVNVFGSSLLSTYPNIVFTVLWNQRWRANNQLHGGDYVNSGPTLDQMAANFAYN